MTEMSYYVFVSITENPAWTRFGHRPISLQYHERGHGGCKEILGCLIGQTWTKFSNSGSKVGEMRMLGAKNWRLKTVSRIRENEF
jgi:hypothetical protein